MVLSLTDITGLTSCTNKLVYNKGTTKDFRPLDKHSLLESKSPVLKGEKTIFILEFLQNFLHKSLIFFLVLLKNEPI